MKSSSRVLAEGKIHEVKGAIRKKVGELTGNRVMQIEGLVEQAAGKVQTLVGKIEKKVGA
jgi:uncharacterized protein YjbJ (UPF0337 family)